VKPRTNEAPNLWVRQAAVEAVGDLRRAAFRARTLARLCRLGWAHEAIHGLAAAADDWGVALEFAALAEPRLRADGPAVADALRGVTEAAHAGIDRLARALPRGSEPSAEALDEVAAAFDGFSELAGRVALVLRANAAAA
jgi:hypothetical protein